MVSDCDTVNASIHVALHDAFVNHATIFPNFAPFCPN